jgi:hypothetical protein
MSEEFTGGNTLARGLYGLDSEEKSDVLRQIEAEETYLSKKIPLEDRERFQSLCGLYKNFAQLTETETFSYAFSLGAVTMAETAPGHRHTEK